MTVQQLFTRPPLTYETAVPRSLVHRHSIAEVFLTDSHRGDGPRHFVIAAQWPRRHAYFTDSRDGRPTHSIALFAETLRQTAIYLAHKYHDVALDAHFVMSEMNIDIEPGGIPAAATDVTIDVDVRDPQFRDGALTRYVVELTFAIDGRTVATGRGAAQVLTPSAYERVRRTASTLALNPAATRTREESMPTVTPDDTGRDAGHDVVLAAGTDGLELRIDPGHHIFFDHPCDHVPGMLMLEAVVQAGRVLLALPTARAVSVHAAFRKFGELDRPVGVSGIAPADDHRATVVFHQDGVDIASGTVVFAI